MQENTTNDDFMAIQFYKEKTKRKELNKCKKAKCLSYLLKQKS